MYIFLNVIYIVALYSGSRRGFGFNSCFIDYLWAVTESNYNSLAELHTTNITVITALIKTSQSSLDVSW
jgi:hypothetical protein